MRTILDNIRRDILKNSDISLSKKSVSSDNFKNTFKFVSDDNKIIGDYVELSKDNLFDIVGHLLKMDKIKADKKFIIFNNFSDSLNKFAKDFTKITHIDFYYMNDDKTYKLPSDEKKIASENLETKRKRLLSIGTWDEKSLKEIEKAKNGFGKWKIEKY